MSRSLPIAAALLLGLAACSNAGEDLGLPPLAVGSIQVTTLFDRDGTGTLTPFDSILGAIDIGIFPDGGIDPVRVERSNANGVVSFTSVPIGSYRYRLMPGALGDTLVPVQGNDVAFRVRADSLNGGAGVMIGYPALTLAEARQAPAGRPVVIRGVVTAGFQSFADSATFLTSGGVNLRVTSAEHWPGRNGNNVGDSVIVLGHTGSDRGQPVLLDGKVYTAGVSAAPLVTDLTVAEVRTAKDGALDAALVRVTGATIADTATVAGAFEVRIANGTDTALVLIDSQLQPTKSLFAPGRGITSRGVLVPDGTGAWYLKPRPVTGEIVVN